MAWYNKINPFNNTETKQLGVDDSFNYNPYIFTSEISSPAEYVRAYGQVGWVFACVSRISSAVAETKWRLYTDEQDKTTEVTQHPLLDLFHYVNKFHTGLEMLEQTQTYIDLTGEVFWLVIRDRSNIPAEIWVVNPNKVKVVPDKKMYIKGYVYKNGKEEIPLSVDDIVHIKLPNPTNPFRGQSPLGAVHADIEAEKYSSQYNRTFFQNSAEPSGVIQFEGTLTDSQYERLRYQWNKQYQGTSNAHKVAILEGGASWQTAGVTQRDMQFRDLRIMNRDTIMGVYGMPKHILGIAEDVNRANAEASEYTFARWVLKPRLERIKAKLNEVLVPMYNDTNLILDYDTPIPADIDRNLAVADQGFKSGYITRNEARIKIGLEPIEDGDIFMEPLSSQSQMLGDFDPGVDIEKSKKSIKKLNEKDYLEKRWKAFVDKVTPLENEYSQVLNTMFAKQKKEIASNFDKNSDIEPENIFNENDWNEELYASFEKLALKGIVQGGEQAKREIEDQVNTQTRSISKQEPEVQFAFEFDNESSAVKGYLRNQALKNAKKINAVTGKLIRKVLEKARNEGVDIKTTRKNLMGISGFSKERAERIARTETISAVNFGQLESAKQSEIVSGKRWLTAIDGSERETHADANGQVKNLDQEFEVGDDYMMAPGQGGLPEENINCRCTITEVLNFEMADQIVEQEQNSRLSVTENNVTQKNTYTYPLAEARCPNCNKLLGKKVLGTANLFCNRCKIEIKFSNNKEKTSIIS